MDLQCGHIISTCVIVFVCSPVYIIVVVEGNKTNVHPTQGKYGHKRQKGEPAASPLYTNKARMQTSIISFLFHSKNMDQKIPYDDYQLPVVFLPSYESPPAWIPPQERIHHPDYNNELTQFLPRSVVLKKPPGAQLGFNIRGGKASQLGIFISKVVPDSDAHRAGLQEGDQVLSVNDVDFQDIEHSKAVEILKTAREILMNVRYFPYNYQRQKERTVH
uniref:PDZ domain-containing protein 11 n=2 Tax=Cyprinus carpio TaxID=7962 RepID=A0A8C1TDA9_CYPCA